MRGGLQSLSPRFVQVHQPEDQRAFKRGDGPACSARPEPRDLKLSTATRVLRPLEQQCLTAVLVSDQTDKRRLQVNRVAIGGCGGWQEQRQARSRLPP